MNDRIACNSIIKQARSQMQELDAGVRSRSQMQESGLGVRCRS